MNRIWINRRLHDASRRSFRGLVLFSILFSIAFSSLFSFCACKCVGQSSTGSPIAGSSVFNCCLTRTAIGISHVLGCCDASKVDSSKLGELKTYEPLTRLCNRCEKCECCAVLSSLPAINERISTEFDFELPLARLAPVYELTTHSEWLPSLRILAATTSLRLHALLSVWLN